MNSQTVLRLKLSVILTVVTVFAMAALGVPAIRNIRSTATDQAMSVLRNRNQLVVDLLAATNELLKREAEKGGRALQARFPGRFTLDPGVTLHIGSTPTPEFRHDGLLLNSDEMLVDGFTSETGGDAAAILARSGNEFIRISTSLTDEEGKRASATRLLQGDPGYAELLRGESFLGMVRLFDTYYMAHYRPILDQTGSVIGALFVGVNLSRNLEALKSKIQRADGGRADDVWIVDARPGPAYGRLLMRPSGEAQGDPVPGSAQSVQLVKDVLGRRNGSLDYPSGGDGPQDAGMRPLLATFTEFKDWDWIVVSTASGETLMGPVGQIQTLIVTGILVTALAIILGLNVAVGRLVIAPLLRLQRGLEQTHLDLRRVNHMYQMLAGCNECLVSVTGEQDLLDSICERVIGLGGYRLAWIGLADGDTRNGLRPVAFAGADREFMDVVRTALAETAHATDSACAAIMERRVVLVRDLPGDARYASLREAALRYGYASFIALPLVQEGVPCFGVLSIYAAEAGAFDVEEVRLLGDLANNLSHRIQALRDHDAHAQAQRALELTAQRLRHLAEASPTITYSLRMIDGSLEVYEVSENVARLLGYSPSEVQRAGWWRSRLHPDDRDAAAAATAQVVSDLHKVHEYRFARRDGRYLWLRDELRVVAGSPGELEVVGAWTDISERKDAEETRERERHFLDTLVKTLPDPVWLKDPHGEYLVCNPRFERLYGAKAADIRGKTDYDFVDRALADFFRDKDRAAMAAGKATVNEEQLTFADDGHHETVETIKTPMFDANGQLIGVLGIARDITNRKQAEAALVESEAHHRMVLAALGEGVYGVDANGRCTFVNRAALTMLGFTEEEMLGQNQHLLFHHHRPDGRAYPSRECPIFKTIRDGRVRRQEEWFIRHDGTGFPVEVVATPVTAGAERIGAVVAFRDISARRQAEDLLRKLSLVVEQSPESIVITDLDGRIEYTNGAFLRKTGYARHEVIGQNPRILQSGQTPAATYEQMWATLAEGHPWKGEFINRRKDGSEYAELARIAPIRQSDGRITHYAAVKEDITERKRIAAELDQHRHHLEELVEERTAQVAQERERAEAANRAKSAFLAAMSHELRTPMNGVVGMIDLLKHTELSPDQRDMMATVTESAYSLLGIIDDILDFSKIEAGKLNLENVPVSIAQVVEGVGETLAHVAFERGIDLLVFVDPEIPGHVYADPVRLRQILVNLAGNAVKFTGSQVGKAGRVIVRADRLRVEGGGIRVAFRVIDNGIGMSAATVAGLFQPFMQADSSTTRRFGGTGLGLSISSRLARLMGGAIEVQSTLALGSTFAVTLDFEEAPQATKRDAPFGIHGIDVVLLTPDKDVQEIVLRYLEHDGANVLPASNPEDAAGLAVAHPPNGTPLVILAADFLGARSIAAAVDSTLSGGEDPPDRRLVIMHRGLRRTPRMQDARSIGLDLNVMHRSALTRAVAVAAGRASPDDDDEESPHQIPLVAPPTISEAETAGTLILVAEDNKTNQKVIARQLQVLGYAAEIADDGADALDKWRTKHYGLVLTDCHMPNMDGFELTAALRREQGDRRRGTPVIAITANALKGEAQRCLDAGMDDYLAKPIQLAALQAALARWLPLEGGESAAPPVFGGTGGERPTKPSKAVNPDVLKEIVGDDPSVIAEFLDDFLVTATASVAEIQAAYDAGSDHDVGALAHRLKSSARTVGADALADLCEGLERAGKAGDRASAEGLMASLETCFTAVEQSIGTALAHQE